MKGLSILALAACGSSHATAPDAAPPASVAAMDENLLVGGVAEGVLTSDGSDAVRIVLSAPKTELSWTIHAHMNDGTQTVKSEDGVDSVDYTFTPSAAGNWFLTIRNQDTAPLAVHTELSLYGAITWGGWN